MAFLTTFKNFILGAPRLATDVFDKDDGLLVKAGGFVDDLHFSDAEKAKYGLDVANALSAHIESTLGESTQRSVTRRAISVMWIKAQLGLILLSAIGVPADIVFKTELKGEFFKLATCDVMLYGTTAVILFFFGAYAVGTYLVKKGK